MAEEWQHNWLYSVVPVSRRVNDWTQVPGGGFSQETVSYPLVAYLTGYCRNCGRAFSEQIPHGDNYMETQMNISKFGCSRPEGVI